MLLAELFGHAAERRRQEPAIILAERDVSYDDLRSRIERGTRSLSARLRLGSVVGVRTDPLDSFVVGYVACLQAGLVAVPFSHLNPHSPSQDDLLRIGVSAVFEEPDPVAIDRAPAWALDAGRSGEQAVVVFTSGTTGHPRPIVHSHLSLAWGIWNSCSIMDELLRGSASPPQTEAELRADLLNRVGAGSMGLRLYSGMPFFTIAGLTVLHRALMMGETLVDSTPEFDAKVVMESLRAQRVNTLSLSPFMGQLLLRTAADSKPSMRRGLLNIGLGGGPVPSALGRDLQEHFECLVTVGYGTTELGGAVCMSRPGDSDEDRLGTIGRPVASAKVALRDPMMKEGWQLGSLACQSPARMSGSLRMNRFVPAPEWIETGDVARQRFDGVLQILGRADGVIIRGGRRIDPIAIEYELQKHPSVSRAIIVPRDSRVAGELDLVALVKLATPATAHEIRLFAAARLPSGSMPQRFEIVDDMPLTADGHLRMAPGTGPKHSGL